MLTQLFWFAICAILFLLVFLILGGFYFKWYFNWELENRRGLNYYGRPLREREAFRRNIKRHAFFLRPIVAIESWMRRTRPPQPIASIVYEGVYGPSFSCSPESFQKAAAFKPCAKDIFVATQMRCGTTWMQQVVFQILTKGCGTFDEGAYRSLYAISPWLEGLDSVDLEEAPLIGSGSDPRRIIKTHMPTRLCPYSEDASYIYVTRHPVACFASIMDYFRLTTGPFCPSMPDVLAWYCSDAMWWLSWPDHVNGWWEWHRQKKNVLFVHFEKMKTDPAATIERVARFLNVGLKPGELERVGEKSSFAYMKANEAYFEMIPPNLFSVSGAYLKSGKIDRGKHFPDQVKREIMSFSSQKLRSGSFVLEKHYPDFLEA